MADWLIAIGVLCKGDPDPDLQKKWTPAFRKSGAYTVVWVKNWLLTNLSVLISDMTIVS